MLDGGKGFRLTKIVTCISEIPWYNQVQPKRKEAQMQNGKRKRKYLTTGPGGMTCPCCGPAPGKRKKEAIRTANKRERTEARKEIENAVCQTL